MKLWPFKKRNPKPHTNLVYVFSDLDGYKYYQFPDDLAIPIERFGKIKEYMIWITRGLSDKQYDELLDAAEAAIFEHVKTGKNPGKATAIIHEMKMRKKTIAPVEIYYHYLALQYVREDEKPDLYNQQIQDEKVIAFKKGAGKIDSFFFHLPELKELCKHLNFTHPKWSEFEQSCLTLEKKHQEVMKYFSSENKS